MVAESIRTKPGYTDPVASNKLIGPTALRTIVYWDEAVIGVVMVGPVPTAEVLPNVNVK